LLFYKGLFIANGKKQDKPTMWYVNKALKNIFPLLCYVFDLF